MEEREPQLKYEALGADVKTVLSKERVSCMCLSDKILALGTEAGRVHILDYSGNSVRFSEAVCALLPRASTDGLCLVHTSMP